MSETLEPEKLEPEKLDLASLDIAGERQAELLRLFPEVRTEGGRVDFDRLRLALGEAVDVGKERYGMSWPGKADCFKAIQRPSLGTLLPARDESVNFDETENLIIEGDNLEVLKLLQKSYQGKVKMIYIDPPYNTGNDFIYPDNFSESLQTYLEYTGQVDAEGRKFSNNTETDGRFHSKWLSMIYPRLYLARNLLREDGVLFVSIDDSEQEHLRLVLNEIFGEENFIGTFVVNATPNARDYGHIGKMHEYAHFYSKNNEAAETNELEVKEKKFRFSDETGGFNVHPLYNSNEAFTSNNRPNLFFPIYLYPSQRLTDCALTSSRITADCFFRIGFEKTSGSIEIYPPKSEKNGVQFVWRWGKQKCSENWNVEIVGYKTESNEYRIVQKMRHTTKLVRSIVDSPDVTSRRGTAEVEEILGGKIASFPKPVGLIQSFVQVGVNSGDIVLDFFAGSGTTAHAALELNKEDGGNRKFILVQLPEPTDREDFKTIVDITKERVRRVIQSHEREAEGKLKLGDQPKEGFRVLKLATSNFNVWNATTEITTPDALGQQLELHIDHIQHGRTSEDLLYEILLKSGFPPTTPIETLTIEGKAVYNVTGYGMLICLEKQLTHEAIKAIAERKPSHVVCLDEGFAGNDQLKTNAVLIMKSKGVTKFQTI